MWQCASTRSKSTTNRKVYHYHHNKFIETIFYDYLFGRIKMSLQFAFFLKKKNPILKWCSIHNLPFNELWKTIMKKLVYLTFNVSHHYGCSSFCRDYCFHFLIIVTAEVFCWQEAKQELLRAFCQRTYYHLGWPIWILGMDQRKRYKVS